MHIYILPQCSTTAARLLNSAGMDAQFERSRCAIWGGILMNRISLLYYYGLLNALRTAGLTGQFSAEDVLKLTKNIYRVDSGDGKKFRVSAIQKKTKNVLDMLGADLLRKI